MADVVMRADEIPPDLLDFFEPIPDDGRTSVMTLGPEPLGDEHYAAYPTRLVTPMVLASTSERGACAVCGAPWRRVVARPERPDVAPSSIDRFGTGDAGVHRKVGGQYQKWLDANPATTVSWEPTCAHADAPTVPCTVLDPFVGSGTTAVVARRLGRSCIGIDLNPDYIEMARRRVGGVPLPLPLWDTTSGDEAVAR